MGVVPGIPLTVMAQIATALAALGGLPTLEEAQRFGTAEPICTIDATGKVKVSPRLAKVRRACQPRPLVRRAPGNASRS